MKSCFLLLLIFVVICGEPVEECFKSNQIVPESILGPISLFPWLGLLMVHVREVVSFRTAVTGVALVKDRYGIAVASDIIKIPNNLLINSTRVMFIVENNLKWYVRVKDYIVHPEQDLKIQAIALLELETLYGEPFKAKPICWPKQGMEVTDLYSFEYVDDHYILQKRIRKMMYIDHKICYEFYEKASMNEYLVHARAICAFSVNSEKFCSCDNGHVLASNDSGYWVIIGIGMFGPSCAAPTRFINLQTYFKWIALITTQHVNHKTSLLRSVLGVGFLKPEKPFKEQPLHESTYTSSEDLTRRRMYPLRRPKKKKKEKKKAKKKEKYPFGETQETNDTFNYKGSMELTEYAFGKPVNQKIIVPPDAFSDTYNDTLLFSVNQQRLNELKITIFSQSKGPIPFESIKQDTCTDLKNLQYRERHDFQGYVVDGWNYVNYWVTIGDEFIKEYTCILVNLDSKIPGTLKFISYLYKSKRVDFDERELPSEGLYRHKKLQEIFGKKGKNQTGTTPKPRKKDKDKEKEKEKEKDIMNFNVLVNFAFKDEAVLDIHVYGIRSGEPYDPYKYLLKDTRRMSEQDDTIPFVHREEIPDDTEVARLFDMPDFVIETIEENSTETNVAYSSGSCKVLWELLVYLIVMSFVVLLNQ